MNYNNRNWIIINVEDITEEMIKYSNQSSLDTVRKTTDGSKGLLKWDGDTPSCFDGLTIYTHSEIKAELAKPEWGNEE